MATNLGRFLVLADPASDWNTSNPTLMRGEIGVADPDGSAPVLKVGDGARPWTSLPAIVGGGGGAGGPDYVVGTTTTLAPGAFATVAIDNTVAPPTISFGIPRGNTGPPNVLAIGTTTTGAPGSPASATITGVAPNQTLHLTIPQGPVGPPGADGADGATGATGATGPAGPAGGPEGPAGPAGPANTLTIGTVTTGTAGSPADATITGTPPDQILNLTIPTGAAGPAGPTGAAGPANTLTIGTVTTGTSGSAADATITGTAPNQTLNLTIPTGPVGATGATGADGAAGPTGPAGADGAPGPAGADGATGPAGPAGPAGADGADGAATFADPTALITLVTQNGDSTDAMRSDAAPALSQAIIPTWTGAHTFNALVNLAGPLQAAGAEGLNGQVLASQGAGLPAIWRSPGGGSVDLIFAFNSATTAADPGAQKCALNASTYAAVTAIYYDITSQTNFDASTILSLLTTGNRIYMQQRNDATRAAVFQVTGAATNMGGTGWWSVPVTPVNSQGAMFANNADVTSVFMLSVSGGTTVANPTATIGLTAVNGVAATAMRSDGAPALSQAIAPTWTATHVFTPSSGVAILVNGQAGTNCMQVLGANSANNSFGVLVTAGMTASDMTLQLRSRNTGNRNYLLVKGDGAIEFGNATDNPTFTFLGTGATTYSGDVTVNGRLTVAANSVFSVLQESDQAADEQLWATVIAGKNYFLRAYTAGLASARNILAFARGTGQVITTMDFGNATDNNAFTFLGTGLTTFNGGVVLGAPTGGNKGAGTINAASNIYVNNVAVATGTIPTAANPTATIGTAAINGSATTFMRSDAAPALSQGISPNWTGTHTFSGAAPGFQFFENDQGTDELYWKVRVESKIMRFETWDTALTAAHAGLQIARGTGNTVASLTFGNVGDAPTYTFNGTGLTTFNGGVVLGAPTGGNKGAGTINASAGIYINNVALAPPPAGAALTKTDDTNVTLTLGGTPATALLVAASLTLGWTGQLSVARGGTGAASLTGYVKGAGTGAMTASATIPYSDITGGPSAVGGANPTASVGTSAVNGSAGTFMRSDAAPALNLAINPTWTGQHTFQSSSALHIILNNTAPGTNAKNTALTQNTGGSFAIYSATDAAPGTLVTALLSGLRSGTAWTNLTLGNATDTTAVNIPGTLIVTGAASAASFTTTSARAMKRETGAPRYAADILARLRPILYRLLVGGDNEQLGLVAEEVRDVCPQLSDGRTVAYDRLAILLLAAWQDEHAVAA